MERDSQFQVLAGLKGMDGLFAALRSRYAASPTLSITPTGQARAEWRVSMVALFTTLRIPLVLLTPALLALCSAACDGGAYLPPPVSVPALRQAGQVTLAANARVFSPQNAAHLQLAGAASQRIRVGGTLSGAFDHDQRRGIYGELLGGVEPEINGVFQYGVLGAVGYGDVRAEHPACGELHDNSYCPVPEGYVDQVSVRYQRYSVQGYFLARAPLLIHGGAGARVSLLNMRFDQVNDQPFEGRGLPVALEPFIFGRGGSPFFQLELQLRYTGLVNVPRAMGDKLVVPDGITFVFGLRLVLGPGVKRNWREQRRTDQTEAFVRKWALRESRG